jgi:hypothetical protein
MAITGGIKFFGKSIFSLDDDTSPSASSGDSSSDFAIDNNRFTYWRSVSSNDSTQETFTVEFDQATEISRLFLLDHNFKKYTIQHDAGAGLTNFSNITSLDATGLSAISETDYSKNTSYYEFDAVTTSKIVITIDTTQTADAEKYLNRVVCTSEIGTLSGYPKITRAFKTRNIRKREMLSGRLRTEKSIETFRVTIKFDDYPSSLEDDLDLCYTLFDRDESFFVWLCGGRSGSDYFKYTLRGFRLQDLVLVQVVNSFSDKYTKNIYTGPSNLKLDLRETAE